MDWDAELDRYERKAMSFGKPTCPDYYVEELPQMPLWELHKRVYDCGDTECISAHGFGGYKELFPPEDWL